VKGIGEKTAVLLLRNFDHSLRSLYESLGLLQLGPLPAELLLAGPKDPRLREHLVRELTEEGLQAAETRLAARCFAGSRAKAAGVVAKLRLCAYSTLQVYKNLVTLKTDLDIESILLRSKSAAAPAAENENGSGRKSAAVVPAQPLTSEYFRFRGERRNERGAHKPWTKKKQKQQQLQQSHSDAENSIRTSAQVEEELASISPALLKPLQYLRQQYHKLHHD
jgi:hypothetical protein